MDDEEANNCPKISVNALGWQPSRPLTAKTGESGEWNWLQVSSLRCNLTGLSHQFNLYFLASQEKIFIYHLTFPDQQFTLQPALILKLPECLSGIRRGEVDPFNPHAVNRLFIGNLGSEEILIVSCDDGDVIGYKTSVIYQVIGSREQLWRCQAHQQKHRDHIGLNSYYPNFHHNGVIDNLPEAFFHRNVGRSAWGLAVHEEARLIAVSANSHVITVFAFALTSGALGERRDGDDSGNNFGDHGWDERGQNNDTSFASDNESDHSDSVGFPHFREKDQRLSLPCPLHNIPSIDFCNTGDDPQGRWLLATNIHGDVMLWDVHGQVLISTITLGSVGVFHEHGCFNGWAVMWMDKRSMSKASTIETATGTKDSQQVWDSRGHLWWDVSASRASVKDASTWLKGREDFLKAKSIFSREGIDSPTSSQEYFCHLEPFSQRQGYKADRDEAFDNLPDCPVVYTASTDIFLLQADFPFNYERPIVRFQDPLFQMPSSFTNRCVSWLTMLIQIPDLGVLIAGCQRGRVGIFTLTQLDGSIGIESKSSTIAAGTGTHNTGANARPQSTKRPPKHQSNESADTGEASASCAFCLEHILPTLDQEVSGHRPNSKGLIGIAAAPIQGVKPYDGHRNRWRLILTYSDCTVLSYELKRSIGGEVEALIL